MLDPRQVCHEAKVDKCRFMDSKKKPLWLVFSSKIEKEALNSCIFKRGDDLRQDALTLQLLKIMDQAHDDYKNHFLFIRIILAKL